MQTINIEFTVSATGCNIIWAWGMTDFGIGIVGGGYMGKAHAVAMSAVAAVFNTKLRPKLKSVAARSIKSAEIYKAKYGFEDAAFNWEQLVLDPKVEAVVIASPQETHRVIAEAALSLGKPVLCEKPLASTLEDARAMVDAAESANVTNMVGFNYIRTPVTQFARQLIDHGEIGDITWFRGMHEEDFLAKPEDPFTWRCEGSANGNMGDLAPHPINAALALIGPIEKVFSDLETVHGYRPGGKVTNDDHASIMCRFSSGVMGHIYSSRIAMGRKMGYAYDIYGTKGAIRFDQEDQNALWLYQSSGNSSVQGFRKILAGPQHPDYESFCLGPGHGTGYQDTIVIEAKDFLNAIEKEKAVWPTFRDGLAVAEVIDAVHRSAKSGSWISVRQI